MSDSEPELSDSYEEEEDMSSDYEEVLPKKRKRMKKPKQRKRISKVSRFIEEQAESGDEEDEEEEIDPEYAAEAREVEKLYQNRPQKRSILDSMSAEDIAIRFEKKAAKQIVNLIPDEISHVTQQQNLPSISDPKLWIVGCMKGMSRQAVFQLMQKALDIQREGEPLPIFSAFASNHVKDSVYIEGFKKAHVLAAIKGMQVFYENSIKLVPIEEMVDVYAMDKVKPLALKYGSFVRVKSGHYKGDLAQVQQLDEQREKVIVKLVPRLETKGTKRGPAKLFNKDEYIDHERKFDKNTGERYESWRNMKFINGFLHKTMSIKSLQIDGVTPSIDELQIFGAVNPEETETRNQFASKKPVYSLGDKVRVVRGDVKGLTGTVVGLHDGIINLAPHLKELSDQKFEFPADDVCKYFESGDYVKVVSGRYSGKTGIVVSCKDQTADVLCDVSKKVVSVLCNDLNITDEVSSAPVNSTYKVNDIITLINEKSCGLVIKVESDCVRAVMDNGDIRTIPFNEIAKKYAPKSASAVDRDANSLNIGDMVRITLKPHHLNSKIGSIRNALRGIVFLFMNEATETHNIVPIKARFTTLLGTDQSSSDRAPIKRDEFIHKLVRVTSGPYRGYMGKVVEILDRKARVELSSVNRTITVDLEAIIAIGSAAEGMGLQTGADVVGNSRSPWISTPAYREMATPLHDTPTHDPFRPEWFGRSPSVHRKY